MKGIEWRGMMSNVSMIDGHIDEPRITDNKIIKALECCSYYITPDECEWNDCPFMTEKECSLELDELQKLSLDLINRQRGELRKKQVKIHKLLKELNQVQDYYEIQKAEIERLEIALKNEEAQSTVFFRQTKELQAEIEEYKYALEEIKAEAIKEFAERLCEGRVSNDPVVIAVKVELKEMVGDAE
jgi:hypothetical protein